MHFFPRWNGQFLVITEGALRTPITYDNHPISSQSHPSIHKASLIIKTGLGLIWSTSNELRWGWPKRLHSDLILTTFWRKGGGGARYGAYLTEDLGSKAFWAMYKYTDQWSVRPPFNKGFPYTDYQKVPIIPTILKRWKQMGRRTPAVPKVTLKPSSTKPDICHFFTLLKYEAKKFHTWQSVDSR